MLKPIPYSSPAPDALQVVLVFEEVVFRNVHFEKQYLLINEKEGFVEICGFPNDGEKEFARKIKAFCSETHLGDVIISFLERSEGKFTHKTSTEPYPKGSVREGMARVATILIDLPVETFWSRLYRHLEECLTAH